VLRWPSRASNFILQESVRLSPAPAPWSNSPASGSLSNSEYISTLPATNTVKFYRLFHPSKPEFLPLEPRR
jgi:hypothetical protein